MPFGKLMWWPLGLFSRAHAVCPYIGCDTQRESISSQNRNPSRASLCAGLESHSSQRVVWIADLNPGPLL